MLAFGTALALGALFCAWLTAGFLCFREDFHVEIDRPLARVLVIAVLLLLAGGVLLTRAEAPGFAWIGSTLGPFCFELSRFRVALGLITWLILAFIPLLARKPEALALPSLAAAAALTAVLSTSVLWQLFWIEVALWAGSWQRRRASKGWHYFLAVTFALLAGLPLIRLGVRAPQFSLASLLPGMQFLFVGLFLFWLAVRLKLAWTADERPVVLATLAIPVLVVAWTLFTRRAAPLELAWVWGLGLGLAAVFLALDAKGRLDVTGAALLLIGSAALAVPGYCPVGAAACLLLGGTLLLGVEARWPGAFTSWSASSIWLLLLLAGPGTAFSWWATASLSNTALGHEPAAKLAACLAGMILVVVTMTLWQATFVDTQPGRTVPTRTLLWVMFGAIILAFFPPLYWWALEPLRAAFDELPASLGASSALVQLALVDNFWWPLIPTLTGLVALLAGRRLAHQKIREAR